MDNIQIYEEVSALKRLGEEYERQLKMCGFDLCDLPDDCLALVNEYADLKSKTKLHDLSESYIHEYYYTKKKEQIEMGMQTFKIKSDIEKLKKQITEEKIVTNQLQEFSDSISDKIISEAEMEKKKMLIEKEIEGLQKRQQSFRISHDINLDDLIAKAELLQKKRKNNKKL